MEETLVDVGHEMAGFLRGRANGLVIVVENNADFVHESDLLFIVAGEVIGVSLSIVARGDGVGRHFGTDQAGVDFGEEGRDILSRDGGGRRHGIGGLEMIREID